MNYNKPSRTLLDAMTETLVVWGSFTLVVIMLGCLAQGMVEFNKTVDQVVGRGVASIAKGVSK